MKKYLLTGCVLTALLLPSAWAAAEDETPQPTISGASTPSSTDNPDSLSVTVDFPRTGNDKIDSSLRETCTQEALLFVKMLQDDLSSAATGEDMPPIRYSMAISGDVSRPNDKVAAVHLTFSTFTGGAHGSEEPATYNYRLPAGEELKLGDIFAKPNEALRIFSSYARKMLLTRDVSSKEDIWGGTEPSEENFRCWLITPSGITLLFAPYQVACYAAGMQTVEVPLSELEDAAPNKELWER